MGAFSDAQLLHIWTEVSLGRGRHGDFLRKFAESMVHANEANFDLMRDKMIVFVTKYSLERYLDTFKEA